MLADVFDGFADIALHLAVAFAHVSGCLVRDPFVVQSLVAGGLADHLLGLAFGLLDLALDFVVVHDSLLGWGTRHLV